MATRHVHNEQIDLDRRHAVDFKSGDRVAWQYRHAVTRGRHTTVTQFGYFHGRVRHTKRHKGDQMALVTFDGQRHCTKPVDDLYHTKPIDPTKPLKYTEEC